MIDDPQQALPTNLTRQTLSAFINYSAEVYIPYLPFLSIQALIRRIKQSLHYLLDYLPLRLYQNHISPN